MSWLAWTRRWRHQAGQQGFLRRREQQGERLDHQGGHEALEEVLRNASAIMTRPRPTSVMTSVRRRSHRSAYTPATGPRSIIGRTRAIMTLEKRTPSPTSPRPPRARSEPGSPAHRPQSPRKRPQSRRRTAGSCGRGAERDTREGPKCPRHRRSRGEVSSSRRPYENRAAHRPNRASRDRSLDPLHPRPPGTSSEAAMLRARRPAPRLTRCYMASTCRE